MRYNRVQKGSMNQALYRKYRSRTLDEIIGQEHITSLLSAAIAAGRIAHAYLLTGPRGVGKTSIARIIAHQINQLPYDDESVHLDIIEIDAASNNSVEDIRSLREKVHIAPGSARYKVYIIDEVHMLSKSAFNALLKTLEEPPAHAVFILATTDADKLPATIISRVQRFNFRAISQSAIAAHLRTIADQEAIAIDDDALALIAQHGSGSFRDSISLLDQLRHATDGEIQPADVARTLGITSDDTVSRLLTLYRRGDLGALSAELAQLEAHGVQAAVLAKQLIAQLHRDIADHPDDIVLLDALLDVASSSHPYIKLLAILARKIPTTPSPVPAAPPEREQPPADPAAQPPSEAPPQPPAEAATAAKPAKPKPAKSKPAKKTKKSSNTRSFDWDAFTKAAHDDIALRSLLAKAAHTCSDDTLTIYAGSKFNAKQLSNAKQLPKVHAALQQIGADHLAVVIKPDKAPPADSQLADVAAIMGGGEQVEYQDGE